MKRLFPWMVEGKTKMGAWQDEDQWRCEEREKEREREIYIYSIHQYLKRCILPNDSNFKSVTCPQPPKPARLTQERQVHSMSEVRSKGG